VDKDVADSQATEGSVHKMGTSSIVNAGVLIAWWCFVLSE
jgi:hypothetical protein